MMDQDSLYYLRIYGPLDSQFLKRVDGLEKRDCILTVLGFFDIVVVAGKFDKEGFQVGERTIPSNLFHFLATESKSDDELL